MTHSVGLVTADRQVRGGTPWVQLAREAGFSSYSSSREVGTLCAVGRWGQDCHIVAGGSSWMAEAEAEAIGEEINTSAAVSFSVGNGVVLTIATGASLEQQDGLPQSIEEAVYEHGRIAWTVRSPPASPYRMGVLTR